MIGGGEHQTPEDKKAALQEMLAETDKEIRIILGEIAAEKEHHNTRKERVATLKARRIIIMQAYQELTGQWYHAVQVNHEF